MYDTICQGAIVLLVFMTSRDYFTRVLDTSLHRIVSITL